VQIKFSVIVTFSILAWPRSDSQVCVPAEASSSA